MHPVRPRRLLFAAAVLAVAVSVVPAAHAQTGYNPPGWHQEQTAFIKSQNPAADCDPRPDPNFEGTGIDAWMLYCEARSISYRGREPHWRAAPQPSSPTATRPAPATTASPGLAPPTPVSSDAAPAARTTTPAPLASIRLTGSSAPTASPPAGMSPPPASPAATPASTASARHCHRHPLLTQSRSRLPASSHSRPPRKPAPRESSSPSKRVLPVPAPRS